MKTLFIKIYSGVLIGVILLSLLSYILINAINQNRYETYLRDTIGGTFSLIKDGIARHQGEKQLQWVDVIERLTGMPLKNVSIDTITDFSKYELGSDKQLVYIQSNLVHKTAQIALPLTENSNQMVFSEVQDINHTITRISALLILNELGRYPKNLRDKTLANINKRFGFDVSMIKQTQLSLDNAQKRQLNRGEIVVNFNNTVSTNPSVDVYAKVGNSGLILHLGPIATFQWYPLSLILPLIGLATVILLIISYLIIHSLEKKLRTLENGIKQAGTKEAKAIQLDGDDGFSRMALSVNDMMQRIDSLLSQQKQLTHDISHELRTPIARVLFRLENLQHEHFEESDKNIVGMRKDLQVLNKMIDEILTYAKLDSMNTANKEQGILLTSFDLAFSIRNLIAELSTQFPSIQFITDIIDPPSSVQADKTRLLRAIENLLINACRHCNKRILIRFSTASDTEWGLTIEDDGQGIPPQHRDRIFHPFVRIDESRARSLGGFGLGLSIVHKTVLLHSGKIEVGISQQLEGAAFTIQVPFQPIQLP